MQQHGSKYSVRRPPTFGVGSKGQNSTFSEPVHVAYKIKWNHECSNLVANIMPANRLLPDPGVWGQKFKIQLFQNIKLKGMTHAATW